MKLSRKNFDTSVTLYMRDVGRHPLLSRAEEVALAGRVKDGDREALHRLVLSNLRLAVKIAMDYSGLGLPLADLIAEGNLGLLRAAELYNPAFGTKFSGYASLWIKQRISRALTNQANDVRVPVAKDKLCRKIRRNTEQLKGQLGREPSDEEVAAAINIGADQLDKASAVLPQMVSLDAPPAGMDDVALADLLPDENVADPSQAISRRDLLERVLTLMRALTLRERKILAARFGLSGRRQKMLEELGGEFRISRERVRQLQNDALAKLRQWLEREGSA